MDPGRAESQPSGVVALADSVVVDGNGLALRRGREWAEALDAKLVIRHSPARVNARLVVVDAAAGRIRWRVRRAQSPIIIARPPSATGRVLVAVDLGDPEGHALSLVSQLEHRRRGEVTLVHSIAPWLQEAEWLANFGGSTSGFVPSDVESARREAERRLYDLLSDYQLRGEVRIDEAPAPRLILDVARELAPDLIVLGAPRHRGLLHAFRRSLADEVAAAATASVLVVPRR